MAHLTNIHTPRGTRPQQPAEWHPKGRKRSATRVTARDIAAAVCPGQDAVVISPPPQR